MRGEPLVIELLPSVSSCQRKGAVNGNLIEAAIAATLPHQMLSHLVVPLVLGHLPLFQPQQIHSQFPLLPHVPFAIKDRVGISIIQRSFIQLLQHLIFMIPTTKNIMPSSGCLEHTCTHRQLVTRPSMKTRHGLSSTQFLSE